MVKLSGFLFIIDSMNLRCSSGRLVSCCDGTHALLRFLVLMLSHDEWMQHQRAFKSKLWCFLPGGSRTFVLIGIRLSFTVLLPGFMKQAAKSCFEIPLLSLAMFQC